MMYVDVVASAQTTILKVSNLDVTINVYANASSLETVVFIYLSKTWSKLIKIPRGMRLHWKPILGILAQDESSDDVGHILTIFLKVVSHSLIRKNFNLIQDATIN